MGFLSENIYQIELEDVGKSYAQRVFNNLHKCNCKYCNNIKGIEERVFEPLGRVQKIDVGRQCVKVGEVWKVESLDRMKRRQAKEPQQKENVFDRMEQVKEHAEQSNWNFIIGNPSY